MDIQEFIEKCEVSVTSEMLEKSIFNIGNTSSVAKVIRKAMRGEEVTICAFGGSITEGVGMNDNPVHESGIISELPPKCYFDHVCDWWESTFECKVKRVNAGIAATDTVFGIHRMGEDVLKYKPDLVILEWCCNDGSQYLYKQATYENMVRELLSSGIAVVLFSMATRSGASSQSLHEPIAKYYNIPMVSYRDAYFEHEKYPYFTTDGVHPNRIGAALAAIVLNNLFAKALSNLNDAVVSDAVLLEQPMCEEALYYKNTHMADLKDIYDGKVSGVRITDLGAFKIDSEKTSFAYRSYYGFSAYSAYGTEPMVIEIDSCRTLFLLLYRNTAFRGVDFRIELNGKEIKSDTFTSQHGSDNSQTEWDYHWATERICYYPEGEKVVLKIYPHVTSENQCVKLFSILIS